MPESPGYPGVIAARFEDDDSPTDLGMDNDSKSLNVNLRVWNTDDLRWERMTPPGLEHQETRDLLAEVVNQLKIITMLLEILNNEEIEGDL